MKTFVAFISVATIAAAALAVQPVAAAPPDNPIVRMTVTLPDGQTKDVSAWESGIATITVAGGSEIGVRPTIVDSKPWRRVVLTFFDMPTETHAAEEIGSVELQTGAAPVQTKTNPPLKVAITSVAAASGPRSS